MELIRNIQIRHFKSLEDVSITGCRRYNLFVGRPNVGKSNILEALALFALQALKEKGYTLDQILRLDKYTTTLFYNGDLSHEISVDADNLHCRVKYADSLAADSRITIDGADQNVPEFKPYIYGRISADGKDAVSMFRQNKELRDEVAKLLSPFGLQLGMDAASQQIKLFKELDGNSFLLIPYDSIADSLRRLIFYKSAISHSKDSVLLIEEPEAHSYPPYIVKVIQSMIGADSNQYFITTHSPYVINEFLESKADTAVFLVDYHHGKTRVTNLTEEQLQQIYEDGIDLFFNTEFFL